MKFNILLFSSALCCFGIDTIYADTRIINNSNASVHVDYELPIYSRADTQITPIKSQQELQDLLYEAILTNSTQEIMKVIKAGADVNLFRDGKTSLMWALHHKKLNSVEVLKRCGAVVPCIKTMLNRAVLNDSADEIRHAIQAGAELSHGIARAVEFARPNAVQVLLDCGAKASVDQAMRALTIGDIKSALLLLKNTPVNKDSREKLLNAKCDHRPVLEYILNRIDPTGIEDLSLDLVQAIIDHGYDINSTAYKQEIVNGKVTQLESAWLTVINGRYCSVKMLELLMKNGANPNQSIVDGGGDWTPLFIAIQHNNFNAVKYLVNADASLSQKHGPHLQTKRQAIRNPQTPLAYARALALTGIDNKEIINFLS